MELFVLKHYSADERPIIKGNGFDGLEIGETREEAQAFVDFVNANVAAEPADKGPWSASWGSRWGEDPNQSIECAVLSSDDSQHDVWLFVAGDFADKAQQMAYAKALADRLNAAPVQAEPAALSDSVLLKLARRTLWIAYVWNDHNFDAPHIIARRTAEECGIANFDDANAWLHAADFAAEPK